MPEPSAYNFTFKELAEMMVREVGLEEGIWGLQVQFGIAATNAGPEAAELTPMALVPLMQIGLQRFDSVTSLSVDASELKSRRRRPAGTAVINSEELGANVPQPETGKPLPRVRARRAPPTPKV